MCRQALQRGAPVKKTSPTMKSGQAKPTGKFSAHQWSRKNPLERGSWQQVTGYRGETGAGDGLCVEWFRCMRGGVPGGQDVPSVTAASESLTHSLQNNSLTLISVLHFEA